MTTDTTSAEHDPKSKPAKPRQKAPSSGLGLSAFAVLMALGAAGFTGYVAWQVWTLEQNRAEALLQLRSEIAQQQSQLEATAAANKPVMNQINALQQREQRLLKRVDTLAKQVKSLEGTSKTRWRVAEAEHLVRTANQRLTTVHDVSGTLELLNTAQTLLHSVDDYSLAPVKEALAEDIAVLKSTQALDSEAVWLRLQALTPLIQQLEVISTVVANSETRVAEAPVETPKPTSWWGFVVYVLDNTWNQFTSLFRITKREDQDMQFLLSEEQVPLMRQQLLLLVEQSKLALMSRQEALYRASLEQVQDGIMQYFMLGGAQQEQLSDELDALTQVKVQAPLPEIQRALSAMQNWQVNAQDAEGELTLQEIDALGPVEEEPIRLEDMSVKSKPTEGKQHD